MGPRRFDEVGVGIVSGMFPSLVPIYVIYGYLLLLAYTYFAMTCVWCGRSSLSWLLRIVLPLALVLGVEVYQQHTHYEDLYKYKRGADLIGGITLNQRRFSAQRDFYLHMMGLVVNTILLTFRAKVLKRQLEHQQDKKAD